MSLLRGSPCAAVGRFGARTRDGCVKGHPDTKDLQPWNQADNPLGHLNRPNGVILLHRDVLECHEVRPRLCGLLVSSWPDPVRTAS